MPLRKIFFYFDSVGEGRRVPNDRAFYLIRVQPGISLLINMLGQQKTWQQGQQMPVKIAELVRSFQEDNVNVVAVTINWIKVEKPLVEAERPFLQRVQRATSRYVAGNHPDAYASFKPG